MSHQNPDIAFNSDDIQDLSFAKRGCCFWIPCLGTQPSSSRSGSVFWQRIKPLDSAPSTPTKATATSAGDNGRWWSRGWKKLREWSELVAGPKWKTLIRRFNRKRSNRGKQGNGKFQYDPVSYSLNFDEGPGHNHHYDKDIVGREFTSRYSLTPLTKTSVDCDREGVTFT